MPLKRICKEKRRLVANYSAAVTRYYQAVHAPDNHSSVEDQAKFEEIARTASAKGHQRIDEHRAEHGC